MLKIALTHRSYAYESQVEEITDNEILEFLGDSVLGLVVADFLVSTYPGVSEGELSKLKSSVASTSSLSAFAQQLKLDKFILLGKGEEKSGGRDKKTILAGAYEALVAAIYLDGGFDSSKELIMKHLKPFFRKINVNKFLINNYKSALQEYFQAPQPKTHINIKLIYFNSASSKWTGAAAISSYRAVRCWKTSARASAPS